MFGLFGYTDDMPLFFVALFGAIDGLVVGFILVVLFA